MFKLIGNCEIVKKKLKKAYTTQESIHCIYLGPTNTICLRLCIQIQRVVKLQREVLGSEEATHP